MGLLNRGRKVHVNKRREMVELINERSLITKYFALTIEDIRNEHYPKGWTLSPAERASRDVFNRTYNGYERQG